jgi:hypothetical protein
VKIVDKIRQMVEAEGYEVASGEESYSDHMFGLVILTKMSERKLCDRDNIVLLRAANEIKKGLQTISAELDPEGLAKRTLYRAEIEKIYEYAGVSAIYMEELPNGYCRQPCCLNKPWFRVTSTIGHVVIGWRKHVLSIDWKDSRIAKNGEELFSDNVTRWETGIHAQDVNEAAEYIRALHMRAL